MDAICSWISCHTNIEGRINSIVAPGSIVMNSGERWSTHINGAVYWIIPLRKWLRGRQGAKSNKIQIKELKRCFRTLSTLIVPTFMNHEAMTSINEISSGQIKRNHEEKQKLNGRKIKKNQKRKFNELDMVRNFLSLLCPIVFLLLNDL